jgi:hypothetical protein
MLTGIEVGVSAADRRQLATIIVLPMATAAKTMCRSATGKTIVWPLAGPLHADPVASPLRDKTSTTYSTALDRDGGKGVAHAGTRTALPCRGHCHDVPSYEPSA